MFRVILLQFSSRRIFSERIGSKTRPHSSPDPCGRRGKTEKSLSFCIFYAPPFFLKRNGIFLFCHSPFGATSCLYPFVFVIPAVRRRQECAVTAPIGAEQASNNNGQTKNQFVAARLLSTAALISPHALQGSRSIGVKLKNCKP